MPSNARKFLNFLFVFIFVMHIFLLLYFLMNPTIPEIGIFKTHLADIQFPIVFKICLFEAENVTQRYENISYDDVDSFFSGKLTGKVYGWGDVNETGTSQSIESMKSSLLNTC